MSQHKTKWFILDGLPTAEQYADVPETPASIAQNASNTKSMVKYDGDGIPESLMAAKMYTHEGIIRATQDPEWD